MASERDDAVAGSRGNSAIYGRVKELAGPASRSTITPLSEILVGRISIFIS